MTKPTPLWRPTWLFAESLGGKRQFIIHTAEPKFMAEIVDEPPFEELELFEFTLGNEQTLTNFIWQDSPPDDNALKKLLEEASRQLDEYDRVITLPHYDCLRCYHDWYGRSLERPTICPKCKSPYWNVPRKK